MSQRIPQFLTYSFLRGIVRGVGAAEDLGSPALSGQLLGVPCISEVCSIIFGCIFLLTIEKHSVQDISRSELQTGSRFLYGGQ